MQRINIKPLSVNEAWRGQRFKTPKYNNYQRAVLLLLKPITLPQPPYSIHIRFGFSNTLCDWDNPVKPFQDILQNKYGFNDKDIVRAVVEKEIVPKGSEYIEFEIKQYKK